MRLLNHGNQRIAVWLLSTTSSAPIKVNDPTTRAKIVKCKESLWKFLYYGACDVFVLKVLYHEPWAYDIKLYFHAWPNQELKLPIKLYYMCQCGFYVYGVAALLAWETRRKDFAVMMSHHVITIILISYSYLTSFFRVGAIILALHDASDVFMESAKIFKYSENEFGASLCFALFALSWLLLRLTYFPFWIIRATSIELLDHLDMTLAEDTIMYYSFNTMLLMLLVFHIYWWYLICAMIVRLLKNRGKVGEDIRSDSEDDE
ncbi:LAG1 longevity assurance-like protein 2 [Raphanus sativus]|nr:LAG1 longevity assurance-like protein 2 [Raphanus sativus]